MSRSIRFFTALVALYAIASFGGGVWLAETAVRPPRHSVTASDVREAGEI